MMLSAQKNAFGDGLDPDYLHPYMWMNKPHYYSAGQSFYNFPYAFGLLFAKGIYRQYQAQGQDFIPKYNELLAATGKHTIEEVAALVKVDITKPAFWQESLQEIVEEIDTFIQLT